MRRIASLIVFVIVGLLSHARTYATDKDFWFGMYNINPYPEVFNELRDRYKMNWALCGINDAQTLQYAKNAGLQIMTSPYSNTIPEFNRVAVFTDEFFLRMHAKGDTAAYQWNPSDGSVTIATTAGRLYNETDPQIGDVWSFDPAQESSGRVMIQKHKDFTSDQKGEIRLSCSVKGNASTSQDPLAFLYLRKWNATTEKYDTLVIDTIPRSAFTATEYKPFELQISSPDEVPPWHTDIVLDWAGTAPMWVDWIGYHSADGKLLGEGGADNNIKGFVQAHGFGGDSAILGFYMAEEYWSDGNVYPHKRVDSLIKSIYPNQKGWTENH